MTQPDYYQPIMPYLVVKDADGFIAFVKTVFDAEEKAVYRNDDGSVMHAEIGLNGGTIMVGQASDAWPPFPAPMYLPTERVDELYEIAIANGVTGNMEPQDKEYGRAAGFIDKWGNQWWLNTT
ncbi:MAG: VOC family protein [Acidobacteria bacterium]|nr:VOC family protein [Acidobacteriota bacterium]